MNNPTTIMLGKVTVNVRFETGATGEMEVNQFRLKDYKAAFAMLDDEVGLVAMATRQARQHIETLDPECFEAVLAKVKEVNEKGFFIFARRKMEQAAETMRNLPPLAIEKIYGRMPSPSAPQLPTIAPPVA